MEGTLHEKAQEKYLKSAGGRLHGEKSELTPEDKTGGGWDAKPGDSTSVKKNRC